MSSSLRRSIRLPLLASLGLPLLVGAGCDNSNQDVELALAEARGQLEALETTRQVSLPPETRQRVFQNVASLLRPFATSAPEPGGSSVKLLLAEALAGQAGLAGEVYREQSIDVVLLLVQGDSLLDLYAGRQALAESLSGYDPSADVAELDRLTSERTAEHSEISQDVRRREAEIEALLDEAAQIKLLAEDKRREAGSIRTQALDADPSRRSTLLVQAQQVRRERELLFVDAERLEIQAARLEPELEAARLEQQRVDLQIQRLSAARERTLGEADALRNESATARQDAGDTAQNVVQSLDALVTLLQGDMAASFDACISKYDEARAMASRVGRDASEAAKRAATNMINLSRASVLRDQSETFDRAATLLARAASATPSLPRAGEWSAKSQEFGQLASDLAAQADDAFRAAAGEVRQAAREANETDEGERIAQRLERLGGLDSEDDGAVDLDSLNSQTEDSTGDQTDDDTESRQDVAPPADDAGTSNPSNSSGDVAP